MNSRGNIRTPIIIWVVLSIIAEVAYYFLSGPLAKLILPPMESNTAVEAYTIMAMFTYLAIPVFLGVVTFLFYSLATFTTRERPTEIGPAIKGNNRLLATWLAASFVLVTVLYVVGFNGLANLEAAAPSSALHVHVTAQQWLFTYTYTDFASNTQSSELYLPVDQPVQFTVTSEDVQHSFWIPELGVKVDAVPGETTTFTTTPNKVGDYTVRCMELCGVLHAYMNTPVHVVSADNFAKWITNQQGITGGTGWLGPLQQLPIALFGNGGKRFS